MARRPPLRLAQIAGALGLAAFFILGFTSASGALSRRSTTTAEARPADAIVVLGAGAALDGALSDQSLQRLMGGLALYHRGLAPHLVVMGPGYEGSPVEAETRAALARDLGVPASAIIVEGHGLTTRHEAALAAARLHELGGHTVLLVTGAHHMPRARLLFERAGLEVVPAPVVDISPSVQRPDARLALARLILQEAIGRLYYRVFGYL
jgi:uncharacterized SAM-binding protein YcdF (DUF218 family)